jgi:beta-N-acetylhexosaminidase
MLGPVMLDVGGTELTAEDRECLGHPAVGGVILFARNCESPEQLRALVAELRTARVPAPLIAVDQEGGRVQRARNGFVRLPPAARFGVLHRQDPAAAVAAARAVGWLMAAELRAVGVDFSVAPVLDLDQGLSSVIGDRAFSDDPHRAAILGAAWLDGVHAAGMAGCGKHFPGHGGVAADSHLELPTDPRPLAALEALDLLPFRRLVAHGIEAVMPAHLLFPAVDPSPVGFSSLWLRDVLRGRLGFDGAIVSDDLSMAAAAAGGSPAERALCALQAGCDLVLVCNDRPAAVAVLDALADWQAPAVSAERLAGLTARPGVPETSRGRRRDALAAIERLRALEG